MEYRQTRHQVARGARPDAEVANKMFLFKRVSALHVTYQIRLLVHRAVQKQMKLVIEIPAGCKVHARLRELARQYPRNLKLEFDGV